MCGVVSCSNGILKTFFAPGLSGVIGFALATARFPFPVAGPIETMVESAQRRSQAPPGIIASC